jgi:hypothetical protein
LNDVDEHLNQENNARNSQKSLKGQVESSWQQLVFEVPGIVQDIESL